MSRSIRKYGSRSRPVPTPAPAGPVLHGRLGKVAEGGAYGFVESGGRSFFLHRSDMVDRQLPPVGAFVSFRSVDSPKGPRATEARLAPEADPDQRYDVPDGPAMLFKGSRAGGWVVLEVGHWVVAGAARGGVEAARAQLSANAELIGANAVLNVRYRTRVDREFAGNSVWIDYTAHIVEGTPAVIARPTEFGRYLRSDLTKLSERASAMKVRARAQTAQAMTSMVILGVVVAAFFGGVCYSVMGASWGWLGYVIPAAVAVVAGASVFFQAAAMSHDDWLERPSRRPN